MSFSQSLTILLPFVAACAGGSMQVDADTPGDLATAIAPGDLATTTFSSVYGQVLTTCATSCHYTRTSEMTTLYLDDQQSAYAVLLGLSGPAPTESHGMPYVTPGDRTNSFLYLKVTGALSAGARMPLGSAQLPKAQTDLLGAWIDDGAKND